MFQQRTRAKVTLMQLQMRIMWILYGEWERQRKQLVTTNKKDTFSKHM